MTMQNNVDIVRRNIRRNMLQTKLQVFAREVDNQRPIRVPIAIPAHDRERRTDRLKVIGDRRLADIAKVPDFIRLMGKIDDHLWQLVVSVGQNENFHSAESPNTKTQIPGKLQYSMIKVFPAPRHFRFLDFGAWNLFGTWVLGFGV